ncbi:MAG TPA: nucleoside triphosphate pyrophosphohydrolase [Acidimicrobiia bacterium]|nr:nucleoside triphosphate pyrophosphohydrolase [Acidimicrobiia bacterium]
MPVLVIGLGPAGLRQLPDSTRELLLDPGYTLILRTIAHPAAEELSALREVITCDDIYDRADNFEEVYSAIVERVLEHQVNQSVIYAVPGSPLVGEFAVSALRQRIGVEIVPSPSFLDATLSAVGYDPLDRGLRILNGHSLPDPLLIDGPTIIAHLDQPLILADVVSTLGRVIDESSQITLVIDAGGEQQRLIRSSFDSVDASQAGLRTSIFIDPISGGLAGAISVMARLRRECPWDRAQTHETLVKNLLEETHELVDAIASGSEGAILDELGDLLLQVLFHSVIATGFEVEDVAENLRQKLIRRHPHVFGSVVARSPEEVKSNWERIKQDEKGHRPASVLDGVPAGMPALERAAKVGRKAAAVGFDWPDAKPVFEKISEEVNELRAAVSAGDSKAMEAELGDLLFAVVNLARHLHLDPELALTGTIREFIRRFQEMEKAGSLEGLDLEELDARWEAAKRSG